jgi:hypothetical protein
MTKYQTHEIDFCKDNGTSGHLRPSSVHKHSMDENFSAVTHQHFFDIGSGSHAYTPSSSTHTHAKFYYHEHLQEELNIFSSLPHEIFKDERVKDFIENFKQVLEKIDLSEVTFPKLKAFISEDKSTSINWIFNYFRVYFSFEEDSDSDSYGMIEKNPLSKTLEIKSEHMGKEYSKAVNDTLSFVLERI